MSYLDEAQQPGAHGTILKLRGTFSGHREFAVAPSKKWGEVTGPEARRKSCASVAVSCEVGRGQCGGRGRRLCWWRLALGHLSKPPPTNAFRRDAKVDTSDKRRAGEKSEGRMSVLRGEWTREALGRGRVSCRQRVPRMTRVAFGGTNSGERTACKHQHRSPTAQVWAYIGTYFRVILL